MTPHFHKTLDLIGSKYCSHDDASYQKIDEVHLPPPPRNDINHVEIQYHAVVDT